MFETMTRMGASGAGSAYEIEKSLRFDSASSAFLNRTFGTPTNTDIWTLSFWVKRTKFGGNHIVFGQADGSNWMAISWDSTEQLLWRDRPGGATNVVVKTTKKFRDSSAWYHIVLIYDSSQGTAADRAQVWVNGVRETSFSSSTYPSQNANSQWNSSGVKTIGGYNHSSIEQEYDGYLADCYMIDGQNKPPENFGKTDPDTGAWIPIEYTGTYGDNGFFLNFSDNSSTSALGTDSSGEGHDGSTTNFSVDTDDEIACDSFSDTPTNNWCIMNVNNNPNGASLSQGGLAVSLVYPHGDNGLYASFGVTSGKWYWEAKCTSAGNRGQVGVTDAGHKSGSNSGYNYSVATRHTGGTGDTSGTSNSNLDAVIDSGNWVTFCFDADNGQIWYSREAAPNISGTANVTGLTLGSGREWKPHIRETGNPVSNFTFNFGASAAGFKYGPPNDDYKPLNAANLPEPTIKKGSDHFLTKTYSGTGSTQTITTGLDADLVWVKRHNATQYHIIANTISGAGSYLVPHEQDQESDGGSQLINGFNSTGFQVGTEAAVNANGGSYVSWNWKESAAAGFDLVSDTGTGSDKTVSHGLGVKPDMMIRKARGRSDNWVVYHKHMDGADATEYLEFNTDNGQQNYHEIWNDTAPTSSVFTVGSDTAVNEDGTGYLTFLFSSVAGYSKVGMYNANNSDNGPFVYTGFAPSWIMIKNRDSTGPWNIFDTKRETYNPREKNLRANTDAGEDSARYIDFLSNGFKLRNHGTEMNDPDGAEYLYLAFADTSFKYANAQ